jgi:3-isopropylmalate/(R)-2-methylmalate dehydratase small subunit
VIAPSFSDIFFNNCMRNGIVPVRLPALECAALRAMLQDEPGAEVTVDLDELQVTGPDGRVHAFEIDDFFRQMLLLGMDEVELTRSLLDRVVAFEQTYFARHPWALPAP